jgi:hypothetical protein
MPSLCGGVGFRPFEQQQTVAVGGRLEGDLPAAHRRDVAAVKITHLAAFGKGLADGNRQRLALPFRALAQLGRHR